MNKLEKNLFEKGYTIDDYGNVYSPNGNKLKPIKKNGYPAITTRYIDENGKKCFRKIKTSRLQAYKTFGDKIYDYNIVVRHLNGNKEDNSVSNIAIGTNSDNAYDIPKDIRMKRSMIGAKLVNKYSAEFVLKIRDEYSNGKTYTKLQNEYKLPKSTINYIIKHKYITH
jgi:hypothetical protein